MIPKMDNWSGNRILIETLTYYGRPVSCPPEFGAIRKTSRACVDWKGGRVVKRVIGVPALVIALAYSSIIATIAGESGREAEFRRLKNRCKCHGVDATGKFSTSLGKAAGKPFLERIREEKAHDMIMGGFGDGRGRKPIVGGTPFDSVNRCGVLLFPGFKS